MSLWINVFNLFLVHYSEEGCISYRKISLKNEKISINSNKIQIPQ